MSVFFRIILLGVVLSGALARAESIPNFPQYLLDRHRHWHHNHTVSSAGAGVDFLRFHREFAAESLTWYRAQPGANLNAVADTWREVPWELKQSAYGWTASLAAAEQRILSNSPAFASEDELGRYIEVNLHNWIHNAAGIHYNESALRFADTSPTSTYFYKIHGLVDYWWSLYRGQYDVGVIAGASGCPSAFKTATLHMDNEDYREASKVSGWVGTTNVDGNGNTNFTFCRVDGRDFRSLTTGSNSRANYAVLKMGAVCPPGSMQFSRYFDNEDDDPQTSSNHHMYPSIVDRNTHLYFCMFKGDGTPAPQLPSLGFDYGVFAGGSFGFTSAKGSIYTDDEDDSGGNDNGYSIEDEAWKTTASAIVTLSGSNTTMYTARRAEVRCGDYQCNGVETSSSCRGDCPVCGDSICGAVVESAFSCTDDCGYCGDTICHYTEDAVSCAEDCLQQCGSTDPMEPQQICQQL